MVQNILDFKSNKAVDKECAVIVVLAGLVEIILKGVGKVRTLFATTPPPPTYQVYYLKMKSVKLIHIQVIK